MPSAQTERNTVVMDFEDTEPELRFADRYHSFNATRGYFTTFEFNIDTIPVGNPNPFCFHFSWAAKSEARFYDQYRDFWEQNQCQMFRAGSLWHENDPTSGTDVRMWHELISEESATSCENHLGIFKNGFCYRYQVVTDICFKVAETSKNHDIEDTDRWKVTGGCFDDGGYTQSVNAMPDLRYGFSQVRIRLELDTDPAWSATTHDHEEAAHKRPSGWASLWLALMYISAIGMFAGLVLFGLIVTVEQKPRDRFRMADE
jgi:hypothetical protein